MRLCLDPDYARKIASNDQTDIAKKTFPFIYLPNLTSAPLPFSTPSHCSFSFSDMACSADSLACALIYDYLSKKDKNLAVVFQKKFNAVSDFYQFTNFYVLYFVLI